MFREWHWRDFQEKLFCKWINAKFQSKNYPTIVSLVGGLSNGVALIHLLEIVDNTSLGRYNHNPRLRIQKIDNINIALQYIVSKEIQITNIGPEDIADGNHKLTLALVWILILRLER
ncbi:calponin homology domain-containing protein [Crepidotus variabilis]|uniref:Calponin homology domain-containing protein n=1 Tax=Crepidotus variabilis TaxID=179855 RepID=A0A9P6EB97_9AGAR|nr:calponin homology domain-containing protein [Crepidotus variabilis]